MNKTGFKKLKTLSNIELSQIARTTIHQGSMKNLISDVKRTRAAGGQDYIELYNNFYVNRLYDNFSLIGWCSIVEFSHTESKSVGTFPDRGMSSFVRLYPSFNQTGYGKMYYSNPVWLYVKREHRKMGHASDLLKDAIEFYQMNRGEFNGEMVSEPWNIEGERFFAKFNIQESRYFEEEKERELS